MTSITRNRMCFARLMSSRRRMMGFTLIELMISMVLGLLLIAGVGSVFLANKDAYRTNEAMSQVQDAARTSFELLAREVRQAGANPCAASRLQSVLNDGDPMLDNLINAGSLSPIDGWDDATGISLAGFPASGEDGAPVGGAIQTGGGGGALRLASAKDAGVALADTTTTRTAINLAAGTAAAVSAGDVLMICDADQGAIFQVTGVSSNQIQLDGSGVTPGNSTPSLNIDSSGTSFAPTSYLAIPENYIWYVGTNPAGGRSLYRWGPGQGSVSAPQEMVRGVWGMQVEYHEGTEGTFTDQSGVANFLNVNGVRMTLVVRSQGTSDGDAARGAGSDRERLERRFSATLALRNLM